MLAQPTLDDGTPTFLTATDDAADAAAAAPAAAPPPTVPNLTLSGLSETPELTPRPHTARPVTTPLDVALRALLDQFAPAAAPTSPRRPTVRRSLSKGGPETHLDAITPQSQVRWAKADGDNR